MPYRVELPPVTARNEALSSQLTEVSPLSQTPVRPVRSGEESFNSSESIIQPLLSESQSYLDLKITRLFDLPPPIHLTPWLTVVDPIRFIETTIADLAAYVATENSGSQHWVKSLLQQKLEHLALCGVRAEIRKMQ